MKLKQLKKQIKGVFKQPKKDYYFGRLTHGNPYFYPWNFNRQILTIRKERPKFLRCKYFKLFGYTISYGWPVYITWYGLGWKDKYDSPRFEWSPSFQIYFFNWQFCIFWNAPAGNTDSYYEQILWFINYSKCDIKIAEETWGWTDFETKESTWNKQYLV